MRKFSERPRRTLGDRTFTGLRGRSAKSSHPPLNDMSNLDEPMEEHMSRAEWLADVEEAVTPRTPDPLAESARNGVTVNGRY